MNILQDDDGEVSLEVDKPQSSYHLKKISAINQTAVRKVFRDET